MWVCFGVFLCIYSLRSRRAQDVNHFLGAIFPVRADTVPQSSSKCSVFWGSPEVSTIDNCGLESEVKNERSENVENMWQDFNFSKYPWRFSWNLSLLKVLSVLYEGLSDPNPKVFAFFFTPHPAQQSSDFYLHQLLNINFRRRDVKPVIFGPLPHLFPLNGFSQLPPYTGLSCCWLQVVLADKGFWQVSRDVIAQRSRLYQCYSQHQFQCFCWIFSCTN